MKPQAFYLEELSAMMAVTAVTRFPNCYEARQGVLLNANEQVVNSLPASSTSLSSTALPTTSLPLYTSSSSFKNPPTPTTTSTSTVAGSQASVSVGLLPLVCSVWDRNKGRFGRWDYVRYRNCCWTGCHYHHSTTVTPKGRRF